MSKIQWTDETWNPTIGCSIISDGCANCYAMRDAYRKQFNPNEKVASAYAGLTRKTGKGRLIWTGKVNQVPDRLDAPLRWRKPRLVFVNSMSDLFHESVPFEYIAAVFGVMAAAPQHTFQVLTKRPERAREFFGLPDIAKRVDLLKSVALAGRIGERFAAERIVPIEGFPGYWITSHGRVLSDMKGPRKEVAPLGDAHQRVMLYRDGQKARPLVHRLVLGHFDRSPKPKEQGRHLDGDPTNNALWNLCWGSQSENWGDRKQWAPPHQPEWPLPGVWLGVSVEDQLTANARIPVLLHLPAAVRWVSYEPALAGVDFAPWLPWAGCDSCGWTGGLAEAYEAGAAFEAMRREPVVGLTSCPACGGISIAEHHGGLDWIVVGGESGHGARPFDLAWARQTIAQAREAGVPVFVKQLGADPRPLFVSTDPALSREANPRDLYGPLRDRKGGEPSEWPEDLRVREWPREVSGE